MDKETAFNRMWADAAEYFFALGGPDEILTREEWDALYDEGQDIYKARDIARMEAHLGKVRALAEQHNCVTPDRPRTAIITPQGAERQLAPEWAGKTVEVRQVFRVPNGPQAAGEIWVDGSLYAENWTILPYEELEGMEGTQPTLWWPPEEDRAIPSPSFQAAESA